MYQNQQRPHWEIYSAPRSSAGVPVRNRPPKKSPPETIYRQPVVDNQALCQCLDEIHTEINVYRRHYKVLALMQLKDISNSTTYC